MKYVKISDARTQLPQLVDSAEGCVITRSGDPVAVLIDFDYFRSLRATVALTEDPTRLERILEAHNRVQGGEEDDLHSLAEAERLIEEAHTVAG